MKRWNKNSRNKANFNFGLNLGDIKNYSNSVNEFIHIYKFNRITI